MEKEKFYIRNKILTYRDLSTNTYLEVSIDALSEANGTWKTLNPATICFSLYDPKVNKTVSTIGICLKYDNAVRLVGSVNNVLTSSSKADAFSMGTVIQIPQYTMKHRKEIVFNFDSDQNNQPVIQLTIIDTSSQRGKSSINLDINAFVAIGKVLKEFVEQPISTNNNIKQLLAFDSVSENFNRLSKIICGRLDVINNSINSSRKDTIDINEYDVEPTQMSEMQKKFQEEFKANDGFSNIDLGIDKVVNSAFNNESLTKMDQPFISTCLNHDLDRLKGWATSFICTTEKSSGELFAPLDFIFNIANISRDDRDIYTNTFGYYPMQYALIYLLKRSIKEAVQSGSYPTNIPAIRFSTKFKRNTKAYNLSKDIITAFLLYSIVVNSFKDETDEIKRSYFAMKLLLSPFMFSIEVDDKLVDELSVEYDKCNTCGMLKSIQDDYTSESYGGHISISKDIFENCCRSFVNTLKNKQTSEFNTKTEIKNIFDEYKISSPMKPIAEGNDIKRAIFEFPNDAIGIEEVKSEVEEPITTQTDAVEEDTKLILFLDSAKGIVDDELIEDIKNTCNKYTDLTNFFKTKDIPHELFKIKRVLDLDPTLTNRSNVLKKSKLFKESEDVTETRVMQEEEPIEGYSEEFDVQQILSMDGV